MRVTLTTQTRMQNQHAAAEARVAVCRAGCECACLCIAQYCSFGALNARCVRLCVCGFRVCVRVPWVVGRIRANAAAMPPARPRLARVCGCCGFVHACSCTLVCWVWQNHKIMHTIHHFVARRERKRVQRGGGSGRKNEKQNEEDFAPWARGGQERGMLRGGCCGPRHAHMHLPRDEGQSAARSGGRSPFSSGACKREEEELGTERARVARGGG